MVFGNLYQIRVRIGQRKVRPLPAEVGWWKVCRCYTV